MTRKLIYWGSTGIVAVMSALAGFMYLAGGLEIAQRFQDVGYPQQLRILLGIAKILGVVALLIPGFLKLKEWAYAGFTFAFVAAIVAHSLAHDGEAVIPALLLSLTLVSYYTRSSNRRWASGTTELSNPQTV
jgi:uncharacterized membrane protein YphA (DoxX/SURF4 family)